MANYLLTESLGVTNSNYLLRRKYLLTSFHNHIYWEFTQSAIKFTIGLDVIIGDALGADVVLRH